jgi:hypothetical protein
MKSNPGDTVVLHVTTHRYNPETWTTVHLKGIHGMIHELSVMNDDIKEVIPKPPEPPNPGEIWFCWDYETKIVSVQDDYVFYFYSLRNKSDHWMPAKATQLRSFLNTYKRKT